MAKTTAKPKLRKPARISAPKEARKAQNAAWEIQASSTQLQAPSSGTPLAQPRSSTRDLLAQAQADAHVRDQVFAYANNREPIPADLMTAYIQQLQRTA